MDPLYLGEVPALSQFVVPDLKWDLGLQKQVEAAGGVDEGGEGAVDLPLQQPKEDPAARVQQVGMGDWDPIPITAENRRAWALNIMTGLALQEVANQPASVPPCSCSSCSCSPCPSTTCCCKPFLWNDCAAVGCCRGLLWRGTGQAH